MGPAAEPTLDILIEAFQEDHYGVRSMAVYALGGIGPEAKKAVPALREAMENKDKRINRDSALRAIEKIEQSSSGTPDAT